MRKRGNTRAGVVLTHLMIAILSAAWALTATAQVSENTSVQLTLSFSKSAMAAIADVHRWREKAMIEAQSGMLDATYGDSLRTAAYEALRQAQSTTETQGDGQTGDLMRQHFANVESWVDELVQARRDMSMDPAGLGQDPDLMNIDECEKALNAMLAHGTYTGTDACQ